MLFRSRSDLEVNVTFGGGNGRVPQCDAAIVGWNLCVPRAATVRERFPAEEQHLPVKALVLFARSDLEVNVTFGGGNGRLPQCDAAIVGWNLCVPRAATVRERFSAEEQHLPVKALVS